MEIRRAEGSFQENTRRPPLQGLAAALSPRRHAGPLSVLLGTALLVLWTGHGPLSWVVGNSIGETDNHHWMMARAVRSFSGAQGPWFNLPEGAALPLMDPVNLPWYLSLGLVHPALAWNLMALALVLLAGLGGWALARELALEPDAALLAGVALASAPFLGGVIDFGISESWGVGWFALHAAALLAWARTGRWGYALSAGLALGAVALSGWYHAVFGLVLEPMLVLWALRRGGWRRLHGVLAQGALGAAMTTPALLHFLDLREAWTARLHGLPTMAPPWRKDWAELPLMGTDLFNFLLPRLGEDHPSKAVYLGTVLLCLVALGLVRRPRLAGGLVLLALPFLLLALGPWPTVGGHPVGLRGPAWFLVETLPMLGGITHWNRAAGAAVPFLAVAAAVGVSGLPGGRWLRVALAVALLGDSLALSPTAWPRAAVQARAPESLMELARRSKGLEQRGVIQLPFDNGRQDFSDTPARLYDRWQVHHGLPRAENYEGVDFLLARSDLVAGWQVATGQVSTLPPEQVAARMRSSPPVLRDRSAVQAELGRLREWGYGWVVLHVDRVDSSIGVRRAVEAALGSPERIGDDLVWRIGQR